MFKVIITYTVQLTPGMKMTCKDLYIVSANNQRSSIDKAEEFLYSIRPKPTYEVTSVESSEIKTQQTSFFVNAIIV